MHLVEADLKFLRRPRKSPRKGISFDRASRGKTFVNAQKENLSGADLSVAVAQTVFAWKQVKTRSSTIEKMANLLSWRI
jgi:hypothetical protein